MRASLHFIAVGVLGGFAALAGTGALAQQTSDGGDYRPMQLNSPEKPEVQQGAIEAARGHGGAGSEGSGTSMAPTPTSATTNSDDIQRGATAAARSHGGAGSESTGSSTAPAMRDGG